MTCYEAFRTAHRKILDSAFKTMRDTSPEAREQHQKLFRHEKTTLHLAYSQEEINDACEKFLKITYHKY